MVGRLKNGGVWIVFMCCLLMIGNGGDCCLRGLYLQAGSFILLHPLVMEIILSMEELLNHTELSYKIYGYSRAWTSLKIQKLCKCLVAPALKS
jgi:hypothetical protein